ncbi:ABC transporter permease [Pseudomonas sichuanensis]|uniref:ABC transporter permease n=1 Tax=Pseudomonas sichuanensis TaxID=2213015 RepID=UPI00382CDA5F
MSRLPAFAYPLISTLLLLLAWQLAISLFGVPDYILASPRDVLLALWQGVHQGDLLKHVWITLGEVLGGFLCGSALALLLGALLSESTLFERFCYPLLLALQSAPKVALAPLILVWFGFEQTSKLIIVALTCFFPLFVNTFSGIRRADPDLLDACRAFSASRAYLFFHVKLPSAAGDIFAGLQIAVSLALIGAVVAEFLAAQGGLGFLVQAASVNMNMPLMFAAVLLLALLGVAGSQLVRWLERRVIFWTRGSHATTDSGDR